MKKTLLFAAALALMLLLAVAGCGDEGAPDPGIVSGGLSAAAPPQTDGASPQGAEQEPPARNEDADQPQGGVPPLPGSESSRSGALEPPVSAAPEPSASALEPSTSAAAPEPPAASGSIPAPPDGAAQPSGEAPSARVTEVHAPDGCYFLEETAREVMDLINGERERLGLNSLEFDSSLNLAAYLRCVEQYENDYFAHTRPDGRAWYTVLQEEVPVRYSKAAENLAWSNQRESEEVSAQQWFEQWKNSESHYEAMIDPDFTHFAVAVVSCPYDKPNQRQSYAATVFRVAP